MLCEIVEWHGDLLCFDLVLGLQIPLIPRMILIAPPVEPLPDVEFNNNPHCFEMQREHSRQLIKHQVVRQQHDMQTLTHLPRNQSAQLNFDSFVPSGLSIHTAHPHTCHSCGKGCSNAFCPFVQRSIRHDSRTSSGKLASSSAGPSSVSTDRGLFVSATSSVVLGSSIVKLRPGQYRHDRASCTFHVRHTRSIGTGNLPQLPMPEEARVARPIQILIQRRVEIGKQRELAIGRQQQCFDGGQVCHRGRPDADAGGSRLRRRCHCRGTMGEGPGQRDSQRPWRCATSSGADGTEGLSKSSTRRSRATDQHDRRQGTGQSAFETFPASQRLLEISSTLAFDWISSKTRTRPLSDLHLFPAA